eukprot:327406-Chlamydomonas_euryale.AAC.1
MERVGLPNCWRNGGNMERVGLPPTFSSVFHATACRPPPAPLQQPGRNTLPVTAPLQQPVCVPPCLLPIPTQCALCPYTMFMSPEEAHVVIACLLVGQSVLSDVTGLKLDWTAPFTAALLAIA